MRLFFAGGDVAHLRPSGNAPQLRIYANADTQQRADEIVAPRRCASRTASCAGCSRRAPSSAASMPPRSERSVLERALGLVSDVRADEGLRAVAMLASLLTLDGGVLPAQNRARAAHPDGGGAEVKSYAAGLQAALLVGFVPAYGWLTRRVGRRGLILGLIGFFFGCLQLFYVGDAARRCRSSASPSSCGSASSACR